MYENETNGKDHKRNGECLGKKDRERSEGSIVCAV